MENILVRSAMHLKSEPEGYHLKREEGQLAFNFVHFLSPVVIVLGDYEIVTKKDACIIYTPRAPQEYYALPGGFINNFVTFTMDDPSFLTKYKLPDNEVFYTDQGDEITKIVEYIAWALLDFQLDHHGDLLDHLYLLFQNLSQHQFTDSPKNQRFFQTRKRFIDLRNEVRRSPKGWDVNKMAKTVFLTRSRFSVLYSEFFGISPGSDLIEMTIEYAKKALNETDCSVSEIAKSCGYDSVEHFIRLFHTRVGMTPGCYKKIN